MTREEQVKERMWKHNLKHNPHIVKAMERDGLMCVDCGATENLLVHHLDDSRKTGILNNDLDNLITLCKKCHAVRHGYTNKSSRNINLIQDYKNGMSSVDMVVKYKISRARIYKILELYTK